MRPSLPAVELFFLRIPVGRGGPYSRPRVQRQCREWPRPERREIHREYACERSKVARKNNTCHRRQDTTKTHYGMGWLPEDFKIDKLKHVATARPPVTGTE